MLILSALGLLYLKFCCVLSSALGNTLLNDEIEGASLRAGLSVLYSRQAVAVNDLWLITARCCSITRVLFPRLLLYELCLEIFQLLISCSKRV
jgi:hypothetical protein